jgi:peptide-methionine (S)-S-oxide reductase
VFEHLPGVISVVSGFTGGKTKNPTYEQVSEGGTGHLESVKVTFDPHKISYEKLLEAFWNNVDPFDAQGQFCDKGDSYKAAIFYANEQQKEKAEASQKALQKQFKEKIVTAIKAAGEFYEAEEYHQHYAEKNPVRYKYYRWGCGRDKRLAEIQTEKAKK